MTLQLGSSGPQVLAWQHIMRERFSGYAKAADGGPLRVDGYYGYDDRDVQREYEARTHQLVDGQVSDHDLAALGVTSPNVGLPVVLCAQGTGVTMWAGPPADIGRAMEQRQRGQFQPLGDWPASAFPMWPSIMAGVASAEVQARRWAGHEGRDLYLCGYSQGAAVVSLLWKYSFADGGPLADLRHRVKKAVTFGNPMREAGRVHHDGVGQPARRDAAGIMVDRLENTPSWWRDYAHAGDLYTNCELDDEGEFKRAICKIVMGNQWWSGRDNIIEQICELFARPLHEGIAAAKAIIDAGMFFGTGTRDHVNYNIWPAVDYLSEG